MPNDKNEGVVCLLSSSSPDEYKCYSMLGWRPKDALYFSAKSVGKRVSKKNVQIRNRKNEDS